MGGLGAESKPVARPPATSEAPPAPPTDVSGPELSILIRTTLIALHDANVTGNYTVLRDLGAVELQAAKSAADLAAKFAEFRQKRIGMAPVVLYDAVLDQKPQLSTNGQLHLVGHIPSPPQEVVFDLWYLYEAGAWRIATINVGTRPPKDAATTDKPAAAVQPPKNLVPPATDQVTGQ